MDKMPGSLTPLGLVAGALCLAFLLPRVLGTSPVQAGGVDLLSLFFADARSVISRSLVAKADSYYHGGIDMGSIDACECQCHDQHDHDHGVVRDMHGGEAQIEAGAFDLWAWIDSKVHVQEHRHLEGEDLNEIVPWIWAACQASPHNIEAYNLGWYVLARMEGKVQKGLVVLEKGIRNNPDNVELEFTRGTCLFHDTKDMPGAEAAFMAARTKAIRNAKGDFSHLPEGELEYFVRSLAYLAFLAKERNDLDSIRTYLRESEAALPDFVSTKKIRELLVLPQK